MQTATQFKDCNSKAAIQEYGAKLWILNLSFSSLPGAAMEDSQ